MPDNIKKSFGEIKKIFAENKTYVPLLQRNYKWSPATAANFSYDLLKAWCDDSEKEKTLGLLTVYQNKNGNEKIEIIDGQQRIISLSILEKIFHGPREINFLFERDQLLENECKTRKKCLEVCLQCRRKFDCAKFKGDKISTDWKRFYINDQAMLFPVTVENLLDCFRLDEAKNEVLDEAKNEVLDEEALKEKLKEINAKDLFGFVNKKDAREVQRMEEAQYGEMAKKIAENTVILGKCKSMKAHKDYSITESYEASCVMCELNKIKRELNICVDYEKNRSLCESFLGYLNEKIVFYWNMTTTEPISEFLSINQNKTDFVVYDYAKAKMILETPEEEKRKEILDIFSEIAAVFYAKEENGYMWNLLKKGYKASNNKGETKGEEWENKENRLKILFDERYSNGQLYGFDTDEESVFIQYCLKIINEVKESKKNRKFIYNAFAMLYLYEKTPFFVLLNRYYKNAQKTAEEILNEHMMVQAVELTKTELEKAKKHENERTIAWKRNYFYEAIMNDQIYTIDELDDIISEPCSKSEQKDEWVCVDDDEKLIDIIRDMWVYDNE